MAKKSKKSTQSQPVTKSKDSVTPILSDRPGQSDRSKRESQILDFWKSNSVFEKAVQKNADGPVFCFYEGPPTANGRPGIHHVLSRVYKDIYVRFYGLRGFHVPRKAGWDCHGLPVEREVEKELGINTKAEIEEKYGLEKFNELCRKSVLKYVESWNSFTERLGFWVDLDDPYFTMDNGYIESVWSLLKQIHNKGLLYQGYKVVPFDPVMGATMSDAEVALGYRTVQDPSVSVKFKLKSSKLKQVDGAFAIVWTTTPWTLPANVALAVHPNESYVVFQLVNNDESVDSKAETDETETYLCAEPLLASVANNGKKTRVIATFTGKDLTGVEYERLYDFIEVEPETKAWYIVTADFVAMDTGTGIVHIAPAYGADDLEVGLKYNLPVIYGAGLDGKFGNGPFAGMFFKDADKHVLKELKSRNLIYKSESYTHEYPFGWRSGAPLMYYAKDAWYIKTTEVRKKLIENNQNIRWVPGHIQEGRFGNWLENNRDWALSRERYWGTPLPVWTDEDGNIEVIGSLAELEEKTGRSLTGMDLHRPYIDDITWTDAKTGRTFRRTPEVIDCWFDSGAMPYAQWPLTDTQNRAKFFPADFICEAVDQTRGWFYTLLAISTMVSDTSSYKNVVCLGHVLDAKGEKMSKSKGNTVDPWDVFDSHGADAIRWYFLTGAPPGNSRRIAPPKTQGDPLPLVQGFFNMIENSLGFYELYAKADKVSIEDLKKATEFQNRPDIDRWILSRLYKLTEDVTASLSDYDCLRAGRNIEEFVDSLSNWYIRRNRRRFWKGEKDADKLAAYDTLRSCLYNLSVLMAPFTPYLAEDLYQRLRKPTDAESVHLCDWPALDKSKFFDEQAWKEGDDVMLVAGLGRSARQKSGRKVRQPLQEVMVYAPKSSKKAIEANESVLLDELNVKKLTFLDDAGGYFSYMVKPNLPVLGKKLGAKIRFLQEYLKSKDPNEIVHSLQNSEQNHLVQVDLDGKRFELGEEDFLIEGISKEGTSGAEAKGFVVVIDTTLTDELLREGMVRDLVRHIQDMRKKAGYDISDRIKLLIKPSTEELQKAVFEFSGYIENETLASIVDSLQSGDIAESVSVDVGQVDIAIKRS